jgi:hypothetical protein
MHSFYEFRFDIGLPSHGSLDDRYLPKTTAAQFQAPFDANVAFPTVIPAGVRVWLRFHGRCQRLYCGVFLPT